MNVTTDDIIQIHQTRIIKHMRDKGPMMLYKFSPLHIPEKVLRRELAQLADDGLVSVTSEYGKVRYELNT